MQRILIYYIGLLCLASVSLAYPAADNADSLDGRIVGGYATDVSLYAHQVSMRYKALGSKTAFSHRCGGSIIASNWVITAAHCIIGTVPSQYQIVAGTNHRRNIEGVIVPVEEIIMHQDYNPDTFNNDIALLRLGTSLPLDNFRIKAIQLAEVEPLNGTICTITGWGTTVQGGQPSDELLAVDVPIVSNELCNDDYGTGRITSSMLCAGLRGVGGKDACQGDSGGPLVIRNSLYGVVSWGYGCAQPTYPGVYSNVAYLLPWIKAQLAAYP